MGGQLDKAKGSLLAFIDVCTMETIMSLNQQQEQLVRDWLQAKQVVKQCPACQAEEWVILEIVEAPVRWPPELHSGGPDFSLVPRGCRNCGYIMFFSATKMGLSLHSDDHDHDHTHD
jgi:predicted nucleic-acid-binding Zn-ribbon protein